MAGGHGGGGGGRKRVADRYLSAIVGRPDSDPHEDPRRSASTSNRSTRTRTTAASSPFGTPSQKEEVTTSPSRSPPRSSEHLFAGWGRRPTLGSTQRGRRAPADNGPAAPRGGGGVVRGRGEPRRSQPQPQQQDKEQQQQYHEDPEAEDLRNYRLRRRGRGAADASTTTPTKSTNAAATASASTQQQPTSHQQRQQERQQERQPKKQRRRRGRDGHAAAAKYRHHAASASSSSSSSSNTADAPTRGGDYYYNDEEEEEKENSMDESSSRSMEISRLYQPAPQQQRQRRPRSSGLVNSVVEKGLEFIFDTTACAAVPGGGPNATGATTSGGGAGTAGTAGPPWRRTHRSATTFAACTAPSHHDVEAEYRKKSYAAWKRGGGKRVSTVVSPPPPPLETEEERRQQQQHPKGPMPPLLSSSANLPLSPSQQSDVTGAPTEVATNRAYDVAIKRIQRMDTNVQEARARLERNRDDRAASAAVVVSVPGLPNEQQQQHAELKSLVSFSSNDESSNLYLRPPTGERMLPLQGQPGPRGMLHVPTMSLASDQSISSSLGVDVNGQKGKIETTKIQKQQQPQQQHRHHYHHHALHMPILSTTPSSPDPAATTTISPPMQRRTFRMPPGSADLCLSPPSIVRKSSSNAAANYDDDDDHAQSLDDWVAAPDPIFSTGHASLSMLLSPIRGTTSGASFDASFVSDDAMFMEKSDSMLSMSSHALGPRHSTANNDDNNTRGDVPSRDTIGSQFVPAADHRQHDAASASSTAYINNSNARVSRTGRPPNVPALKSARDHWSRQSAPQSDTIIPHDRGLPLHDARNTSRTKSSRVEGSYRAQQQHGSSLVMVPRIASNRVSKTHQAPDPHGYRPKATRQVEHRKVIAAVPVAASNFHHDDHDEEQGQEVVIHDSSVNDNSNLSQNSVAKAFLEAVARRRGAGPASSTGATQQPKPSISSKLGRSHDHHHQQHHTERDDQASVDVKSIRSLFESKDKNEMAPRNGQPDDDGDDDDTVSVRSLKEIFEPPQSVKKKAILESKCKLGMVSGNVQNHRDDDDTVSIKSLKEVFEPPQIAKKCDDQSTGSSIGRLRAMFEAKQPKPASKGKFTDSNSVAKRSFSMFEEQSKKKDVGRSMPPRRTTSKQSFQQRPIHTLSAALHSSNCDNNVNDESTEGSCPTPHFVGNIDVTMSEASILQGLAMSTDPSNDLSPPNRGRSSKQPDPSPMWQGHREKVLTKRFRSRSSGSFRRSSSTGSATDDRKGGTEQAPVRGKVSGDVDHALAKDAQISAKGFFPERAKNAQTQAATKASLPGLSNVIQVDRNCGRGKGSGSGSSGSGLDAHLQTRQAQNAAKEDFPGLSNAIQEACQSSKAESSTERAQNTGHLPEQSTSSVRSFSRLTASIDNQGHSSPMASKSTSHAFDSPGSSDFTDGVTLDASIMDVSVLTNPTDLISSSRGGRRRRRHDSDGSEDSKNEQKHSDENEAAAKQSEASSSQPSMSAVPLLAKIMMNLPQSDEFSALVSKHSKLKRVWSQSQDSDDCSDEEHDLRMAYGYDALSDTDEARWNLHHVHTLFPSKQPVVSGIKSKKEYVSDWEPFEEAAKATEAKEKPKQLPSADNVQIKSTNEKSTSQRRDLAGLDVPSRRQTSDIFDKSVSSMQYAPEKGTFPFARKYQLPMRQTTETSKLRPTAATKMIPSVSLAAARAPKPFMSASNSSESTRQHGNLANRATLEKKEQRLSYLSRYAQAAHVSLQGQREDLLSKANIAASVRSDSEKPSISSTSAKGSTHAQAYLKAWRRTLDETNSPATDAPLNRQQPVVARPVSTPRSRPERQKSPGHVEVPQSIRQRSLHAEDADLMKPTVNALDSPRARDFEGRAIRRLRMRQMIDSFEQSPGVRSVVPVDQDRLSDNAHMLSHKKITRSSLFPRANSNIHHRPSPRSDPGVATQSLQAGRGSFSDRAAQSLISRRANGQIYSRQSPVRDPTRKVVNLDLLSEATTANGSSSDGTYASPRTPRSQLIERFNQRLTPEQRRPLNYEEINFSAASAALGSTTPTRSNISFQRDLSVHSDAVDIMPFLLPALETAKPTNRYSSSSVGSTSLSRSVAPASLSSDVVGYASTSGSSSLYAKSVAGAPGHPVYRPKYTALRNRLRTLRESRLRREYGKQEFMESPTAVVDGLPTRFKS